MSHTRSQGSSQEATYTQAEVDVIIRKNLEKEKQLRDQAESLKARQLELDRRQNEIDARGNSSVDIESLASIIVDFRRELSALKQLPEQISILNRKVNDLMAGPPREILNHDNNAETTEDPQDPHRLPYNQAASDPRRSNNSSPVRLKEVINMIPKYNGNNMSVYQFCKSCERAQQLVPYNHIDYLIQLIISKLFGHAYTAVEGTEFHTVQALLRQLKQVFGPNKSSDQIRGELGNIYMKPNENIFDYVARIKELRTALMDEELNGYPDNYATDRINNSVMHSFINGLPSDLMIRVRLETYGSLEDAISIAIQITKTMDAENQRKKNHSSYKPNSFSPRADYNRKPVENSSESPPRPSLIKPFVPGRPGPNSPPPLTCHYCKQPGHFMANCKRLAYRRSQEATGNSYQANTGNARADPVIDGVRREASPQGRPATENRVRFAQKDSESRA